MEGMRRIYDRFQLTIVQIRTYIRILGKRVLGTYIRILVATSRTVHPEAYQNCCISRNGGGDDDGYS